MPQVELPDKLRIKNLINMDHVAIMKKDWGLLPKILSGEKTIESRWYKTKREAFGKVKAGNVFYFKDSGEPVSLKAKVKKVLEFENLTPQKVKEILYQYGQADGLDIDKIPGFFGIFKNKKYCMLIFLKNPRKVKPFNIDKKGFGAPRAWLSVNNIRQVYL